MRSKLDPSNSFLFDNGGNSSQSDEMGSVETMLKTSQQGTSLIMSQTPHFLDGPPDRSPQSTSNSPSVDQPGKSFYFSGKIKKKLISKTCRFYFVYILDSYLLFVKNLECWNIWTAIFVWFSYFQSCGKKIKKLFQKESI